MIKNIITGFEICITLDNRVGGLTAMAKFLVDHGINVEGISGHLINDNKRAELMFITDDNFNAIQMLEENGYEIKQRDVMIIQLENRPGALKNITERLAQNDINIEDIYCTTCFNNCPAKVVLVTSDNDKAISLLAS
jgi:hypothetical protein